MINKAIDILIVGAGPVGLMCAYLCELCGISSLIVDKSEGPLKEGRADAFNARTLQLLHLVGLFDDLYPLGKPCNTSSVWAEGRFISRQSSWWESLEGCFHKHFLMLGQSYVEHLLDQRLKEAEAPVRRSTNITNIEIIPDGCLTTLSNGETIRSRYVIGADGSQSLVRKKFEIPFEIIRPQIVWAVIDGLIETNFPKVPEIIVFQAESADVAWIPREGNIDRFYVRMDIKDFTFEEAREKINRAIKPYALRFKQVCWYSNFSVKESVAEKFFVEDRIFLAGDSCHIHSVNGGQGLNTGLGDAFNLIWKLNMVINHGASKTLLQSYESERRPVAQSVIASSGELVRSTKYSANNTHAEDYVKIVEKRAGNITGMGIRYGTDGLPGSRLFDFEVNVGAHKQRLYSLLDYRKFSLFLFGDNHDGAHDHDDAFIVPPDFVKVVRIQPTPSESCFWTEQSPYVNQALLVRPDSYIETSVSLDDWRSLLHPLSLLSKNEKEIESWTDLSL